MNSINWYPGHMAKAKRMIKEKINMIDIVLELVDARMPFSSKMNDIDDFISNKTKILVMTKYDLCDEKETDKWVKYYESKNYKVLKSNLNDKSNYVIKEIKKVLNNINEKRNAKGLKSRKYRVLILGVPNVGKSTLINKLVGKKVVKVANKPGVTKGLDWIRINDDLELMDSPGLLWPKFSNEENAYNLASFASIKQENIPFDDIALHILKKMEKYYPSNLEERYGVKVVDENVYDVIGKKRGFLLNGEVDYDRVFLAIINDLKEGRLGNVTFDRCD